MQRKRPLAPRNTLETRLWVRLKALEGHRNAKFLSLLTENLVRKGLLSEQEVVHMLDQVVD